MLNLPIVEGVIKRRLLVNFRVDPEVLVRRLPRRFRPKLHRGSGIATICLTRLEDLRPRLMPPQVGVSSENASHRIAVCWQTDEGEWHDGVYIERRDTSSMLSHLAGGRIFPGEQRRSRFEVHDDGHAVTVEMASHDGRVQVRVEGRSCAALPADSIFASLDEASRFCERGMLGYASVSGSDVFDGLRLRTDEWVVHPFAIGSVHSSMYENEREFPPGSVALDHALVMRDVQHAWVEAPALCDERAAG